MKEVLRSGFVTGSLLCGALACTAPEEPVEAAPHASVTDELQQNPHTYFVQPGEAVLAKPETDKTTISRLTGALPLKVYQQEHGFTDPDAPEVSAQPLRVSAHIDIDVVEGADDLDNDLTCDTLNVNLEGLDENKVRIGTLVLGNRNSENLLVSWPLDEDGDPAAQMYICMADGVEPAHGAVLFATDQLR